MKSHHILAAILVVSAAVGCKEAPHSHNAREYTAMTLQPTSRQLAQAQAKTDVRIRQIAALESAVVSTRELMRHSESTYLEVLTAQQSLLSARLLQVSDRYDLLKGTVSLYRALGGGSDQ